jgi:mRNA-degrading endonuclease toxin of MazEF toxin-antitoxin module
MRRLRTFVGTVAPEKMQQVCQALLVASGCDR